MTPEFDLRAFSAAFGRRDQILREWRLFLRRYPILITPASWTRPFSVDGDQQVPEVFREILQAQSPMLAVALLGIPGLTVPSGVIDGARLECRWRRPVPRGPLFRRRRSCRGGESDDTPIDPRA